MSETPKLKSVRRLDSVPLEKVEYTPEGFLIDTPILTSVGIFEYHENGKVRMELRLPEHVFDKDSLSTYEGKPVIITHEAGRVTKRNVTDVIVGTILSPGYQDGDDVRAKVVIHDTDEVKHTGMRELSLGYDLKLDETPGIWNGQHYDAIQTEIVINHLAVVMEARAGEQARLNIDGKPEITQTQLSKGEQTMAKNQTQNISEETKKSIEAYNARKKRRLDEKENGGFEEKAKENEDAAADGAAESAESETTPEGRLQLLKDRRDRRDQEGTPETPDAALGVIAQQDEDIDELLEIIEALQAKSDFDNAAAPAAPAAAADEEPDEEKSGEGGVTLKIQADAMDAIVRERLKLGRLGDKLNLDGLEDMKPADAKKAIIKKVNPSMRLDGKGAAYINAAFDIAVEQINAVKDTNYQRRQASGRMDGRDNNRAAPTGKTSAELARAKMINKMKGEE